jgi:RNA polymerase sigma-B factor
MVAVIEAEHSGVTRRAEAEHLFDELNQMPEGKRRASRVRVRLVELHMPLVIYLANRFSGRSEPMDDLVQVATIGLLKAIDRFEPDRGLAFSTYATPTILGEIKRHFRDTAWLVHVPRRAREMQVAVRTARGELSQRLSRSPTIEEIADFLDIGQDVVVEAVEVAQAYSGVPLDALVPPGEVAPTHPGLASSEAGYERTEQRALLRAAIAELPQAERETLLLRFFGNKTQTEIAALLGVSQMQISRLVARGLSHLREKIDADVLLSS